MFIKITKSGKHEYAQVVESYRENGATRHKVILNLGRLDMIKGNPTFQHLAIRLMEISNAKNVFDLNSIKEALIVNYGYKVGKKLWNNYGLSELLTDMREKTKIQYDLNTSTFLMAAEHLMNPKSKLGTYNNQLHYANLPNVGLNHLYRSLDILSEHKETVEDYLFNKQKTLFNMSIDVVF